MLLRLVVVCSALFVAIASPVLADAKSDAIAACSAQLKRDGIPTSVSSKFSASGSGDRIDVSGYATYQGQDDTKIVCKTHEGRVTHISFG
jgi:hypothetical protein